MDENEFECPVCGEPSGVMSGFDNLGKTFTCPNCDSALELEWEETWDDGWFSIHLAET